jgi:hypothetical protein
MDHRLESRTNQNQHLGFVQSASRWLNQTTAKSDTEDATMPTLGRLPFTLKGPVGKAANAVDGPGASRVRMQNCPKAVWFDLVSGKRVSQARHINLRVRRIYRKTIQNGDGNAHV